MKRFMYAIGIITILLFSGCATTPLKNTTGLFKAEHMTEEWRATRMIHILDSYVENGDILPDKLGVTIVDVFSEDKRTRHEIIVVYFLGDPQFEISAIKTYRVIGADGVEEVEMFIERVTWHANGNVYEYANFHFISWSHEGSYESMDLPPVLIWDEVMSKISRKEQK